MTEKEKILFFENRFGLESINMVIKHKDTEKTDINGVGHIKQNSNGKFEFYLYCTVIEGKQTLKELSKELDIKNIGKLIPYSRYVKLYVKDIEGREWESEYFYGISSKSSLKDRGIIYYGEIEKLKLIEKQENIGENFICIEIIEKEIEMPINGCTTYIKENIFLGTEEKWNRNIWHIEDEKIKYYFEKTDNGLKIYVSSKMDIFNELYGMKIEKALQFVLGYQISWNIIRFTNQNKKIEIIRGKSKYYNRSEFSPPLYKFYDKIGNYNELFLKYLKKELMDKEISRISYINSQIIKSSKTDLYTKALIICVSIENLVNKEMQKYREKDNDIEKEVKYILDEIKKMEISEKTKIRISGMVVSIKNKRVVDMLHELKNKFNLIQEKHIKSWQELRNASAHGSIEKFNIEKMIDYVNEVTQLYYFLMFYILEYDGNYTDYSEIGWPTKNIKTIIDM